MTDTSKDKHQYEQYQERKLDRANVNQEKTREIFIKPDNATTSRQVPILGKPIIVNKQMLAKENNVKKITECEVLVKTNINLCDSSSFQKWEYVPLKNCSKNKERTTPKNTYNHTNQNHSKTSGFLTIKTVSASNKYCWHTGSGKK